LKRRRKMKKVRKREEYREEVSRVQRGEVSAVEVFEEKMKRRVEGKAIRDAGERRREEKRLRKKEAWLKRMREGKAAAMAAKRVAAEGGGQKPPGCAPTSFGDVQSTPSGVRCTPPGKVQSVVDTLLGRVAALEERLEVQEVREKRRVREAYEEGRRVQVKKGEAVVEELTQRSERKVRRLTWELEEEKRKGLLQKRSAEGVKVKDRLTAQESRIPKPVTRPVVKPAVRAGPQWRDWEEKWEAARKRKDEADKEMTRIEAVKAEDERRWHVGVPKRQREDAGKGRGARRPGRPVFRDGQTDVRLGTPGVSVVRDVE
jgi:hypothetical protein